MGLTLPRGARVYLDANIIIYATENTGSFGDRCRAIFRRFTPDDLTAFTSELSVAEVLVQPFRTGHTASRDEYLRFFSDAQAVTVVPLVRPVLIDSARVRASSRLKLADAIHVASALASGCTFFLTNDHRLGGIGGLRVVTLDELAD